MVKDLKTHLIDDKIVPVLRKFMIFDTLTPDEIREVLRLDSQPHIDYQDRIIRLKQYGSGEVVIREGDFDCWSYWVVKGVFDVRQGGQVIVSFHSPGEIFGEMSVLEGIPRTASVVCRDGGVCLCIDMSILENLGNDRIRNIIRRGVYQVILMRLSATREKIETEKSRLEAKYAGVLSFEENIRKKLYYPHEKP